MKDISNKRILLIGGGGHCRSVIDSIISLGEYSDIGIVDDMTESVMGVSVVGNDNDLYRLKQQGWSHAFVTVGSVGNTTVRRKLFCMIQEFGFTIPNIVDASAVVASTAVLDMGTFVGKRAIVNANANIGKGVIINTGAIVEHDCCIGDFSHVSSGATLCGQVSVMNDTHIGAGTVVKQQVEIGKNVLVGIGSVVTKDIRDYAIAYGNPCKEVKEK